MPKLWKVVTLQVGLVTWSISSAVAVENRTVKTNHTDVNLWSEAGREDGAKIDKVKRFEEIQVLQEKTLGNGQTWFRVQLRRYPGDQLVAKTGWVDARYFTAIETPTAADQPGYVDPSAAVDLEDCQREPEPILQQRDDLAEVAKAVKKSSDFIWPVPGYLRSGFGYRTHPIKGIVKLHRGMDISGNNGAAVRAARGGVVEVSAGGCRVGKKKKWKRCNGGAGNMVTIRHDDGSRTRYLHMGAASKLPRRGSRVSQGEVIGFVGATGAVTGPHLHFELKKSRDWENPLKSLPERT